MYLVVRAILRFLCFLAFKIKVVNRPTSDPDEGLIICPNHQSILDIVVMAVTYPGRITFVGKKNWRRADWPFSTGPWGPYSLTVTK